MNREWKRPYPNYAANYGTWDGARGFLDAKDAASLRAVHRTGAQAIPLPRCARTQPPPLLRPYTVRRSPLDSDIWPARDAAEGPGPPCPAPPLPHNPTFEQVQTYGQHLLWYAHGGCCYRLRDDCIRLAMKNDDTAAIRLMFELVPDNSRLYALVGYVTWTMPPGIDAALAWTVRFFHESNRRRQRWAIVSKLREYRYTDAPSPYRSRARNILESVADIRM